MTDKLLIVHKILSLQIVVIIVVFLGFYLAKGGTVALSPLLGGLIAFVPNLYFAIRTSMATGQPPQKILNSFYAGEFGKLILTGILFYVIFQLPNIQLLPLLTGYVTAL
jgi:ATP synthase protein I